MKFVRMITAGLVLWSLTLVWPETNLVLLPRTGLTWALMGLIGLFYLLLARRSSMSRQLAAAYAHRATPSSLSWSGHNNSLHSRPTRPYPVIPGRNRDSRPTRPMPQL